jgi:hypothetical protein
VILLIIALVSVVVGFGICWVICVPTREMPPTSGPHTRLGPGGDFNIDIHG